MAYLTSSSCGRRAHTTLIAQLDRYAADHDLARAWGLESSGGHVKLVRLAIIFQGGDRVLCEAV